MTPERSKPLAIIPTGTVHSKVGLSLVNYHPRDLNRVILLAEETCAGNWPLRAPFVLFKWRQLCSNIVINSVDTPAASKPNRRCFSPTPANQSRDLDHFNSGYLENWNLRDPCCIYYSRVTSSKEPCIRRLYQTRDKEQPIGVLSKTEKQKLGDSNRVINSCFALVKLCLRTRQIPHSKLGIKKVKDIRWNVVVQTNTDSGKSIYRNYLPIKTNPIPKYAPYNPRLGTNTTIRVPWSLYS
jgi:hypothetical protein